MSYATKKHYSEFKPVRTRYVSAGSSCSSAASVIIWTLFVLIFCVAPVAYFVFCH